MKKVKKQNYINIKSGLLRAQAMANIGHWELNLTTDYLYWSDEVYRIFGLKPQSFEASYEAFLEHVYVDDIDFVNSSYQNSLKEKKKYQIEHRIVRKNGEIGYVEEICEHKFNKDGEPIKSIGTVRDITKQKIIQNELFLVSEVFEKMSDGVLITDEKQHIIKANNAFMDITGYTFEEMKGKSPSMISSCWHNNIFYETLWDEIDKKGKWRGEIIDRKKDGTKYTAEISIIALYNNDNVLVNYISIIKDISDKKEQENLIHNLAYYDPLTELPNRVLFEERLKSRIPSLKRNGRKMALLFIDMDNFKNINDTLGHIMGDKFLIEVASSIKKILREEDTLARIGGDEFTILLEDIDSIIDIVTVVDKIINKFTTYIEVDNIKLYSGVSMGISIFPDDGTTYDELIKAADTAMYQVKDSGKQNYQFYTKKMNEKIIKRVSIENDLRNAINKGELFLEYQPQVDIENKNIYGMEALIRWNHPKQGLIRPDDFISIAEDTGQIMEIGSWVIKQAIIDAKKLHSEGFKIIISINVSSKQLQNKSFVDDICEIVEKIGFEKNYIDLEITESHIMNNIEKALSILNELNEKGFRLSIDDFGTGYSSLSYLKKLPVGTIKIDRSFVLDIDKDEDDRSIVATVIAMAKALGKDVIAEGSETKKHVKTLKDLGCQKIQGYYFNKPLHIDKFMKFIKKYKVLC